MSTARVWIRRQGKFVAVIESVDRLEWKRRYQGMGTLTMEVRRTVDGAQHLTDSIGDEISVIDSPASTAPDLTFVIEALEFRQGERGAASDTVKVRAVEAGLLHMRIALPPPHTLPLGGSSHHIILGDAETAMREIVDKNLGPSAPAKRQFPGLVMDTNQNRGITRNWQARFEPVIEKLTTWAETSDLGFEVQYDAANNEHVFKVLEGEDKSSKVEFSVRLDNIDAQEWIRNGSDNLTFAWVAGQGTGEERDMAGVHTGTEEPEGRLRREMFVDARDLESENDLPTRGEEKLAGRRLEESFAFDLGTDGPFSYKQDFDLGDIVGVRNDAWDLSTSKRIVEVTTRHEGNQLYRVLTLGKAPKDLRTRVAEEIGDQATARSVVFEQGVHPEGRIVGIRTFASGDNTVGDDKGKLLEGQGTLNINKNTHERRDVFYVQQVGTTQVNLVAGSGVSFRYANSSMNSATLEEGALITVIMVDDTVDAEVFAIAGQLAFN